MIFTNILNVTLFNMHPFHFFTCQDFHFYFIMSMYTSKHALPNHSTSILNVTLLRMYPFHFFTCHDLYFYFIMSMYTSKINNPQSLVSLFLLVFIYSPGPKNEIIFLTKQRYSFFFFLFFLSKRPIKVAHVCHTHRYMLLNNQNK